LLHRGKIENRKKRERREKERNMFMSALRTESERERQGELLGEWEREYVKGEK